MINANEKLDAFASAVERSSVGEEVCPPWSKVAMQDTQQGCALALIRTGKLGAAESKAGRMQLYVGRENAGMLRYKLVNAWLLYTVVVGSAVLLVWLGRQETMLCNLVGSLLSTALAIYFAPHAISYFRFAHLWVRAIRLGQQTRLGCCVLGYFIALGGMFEFFSRIVGGV